MNRRRHGFTLIELLVVIGIILVLVGMAVVGYNQLDRTIAGRSTRTTLHNLAAMEAELDAEAGPDFVEAPQSPPAVYVTGATVPCGANTLADVNPAPAGTNTRYAPTILGTMNSTQAVILQLMRSVKNKESILGLSSKQLLKDQNNNPLTITDPNNPNNTIPGPVLLDAWQNPIVFVPSGGLQHVMLTQAPNGAGGALYTVRSSGVYAEPLTTQQQALGPKDRPFWASAGQDGDFSKGDDNIYSFEN